MHTQGGCNVVKSVKCHILHQKNERVALTQVGYLSCSFTTKQCECKQIDYIAGPLQQVFFAFSDMQTGKQLSHNEVGIRSEAAHATLLRLVQLRDSQSSVGQQEQRYQPLARTLLTALLLTRYLTTQHVLQSRVKAMPLCLCVCLCVCPCVSVGTIYRCHTQRKEISIIRLGCFCT